MYKHTCSWGLHVSNECSNYGCESTFVGSMEPKVVYPEALKAFDRISNNQYEKGIKKYGRPLMTYDGRDVVDDVLEEMYDGWIYTVKLGMMYKESLKRIKQLETENEQLKNNRCKRLTCKPEWNQ